MAHTTFPNCLEAVHVDRRQLLASAATMAAAGVLPGRERAEAVDVAKALPAPPPPLEARSFGTVAARRIWEISRRNRLRQETGLPLLSIPKELRRMKNEADAAEFGQFVAKHERAVWDEVLKPIRDAAGDRHDAALGVFY
jgi:hypothetical protein